MYTQREGVFEGGGGVTVLRYLYAINAFSQSNI